MLTEFMDKLRYMRRTIVECKYTLDSETARLRFVSCKENLVNKTAIVIAQFTFTASSTLNRSIMVWLTIPAHTITQLPPCCFLLARGMSELDKIHPLAYPSGPSNVTQDLPVKIILKCQFLYIPWPNFDALKYLV